MRLNYKAVKKLCQLVSDARVMIRKTKNVYENTQKLQWFDKESNLTLKDYHYHLIYFCNPPYTHLLDTAIEKLEELSSSKSKIADYTELRSDLDFLKEYYAKNSWNDVTRWLTNIDSTLRETFSVYMENLKKVNDKDK